MISKFNQVNQLKKLIKNILLNNCQNGQQNITTRKMMNDYRKFLLEAITGLKESQELIFSNAINLAMSSEMKEYDELFELGDKYEFDIKQFEDSKDANVQLLVTLVKAINSACDSIININAITDEELESIEE